jgi:hypothetical protein
MFCFVLYLINFLSPFHHAYSLLSSPCLLSFSCSSFLHHSTLFLTTPFLLPTILPLILPLMLNFRHHSTLFLITHHSFSLITPLFFSPLTQWSHVLAEPLVQLGPKGLVITVERHISVNKTSNIITFQSTMFKYFIYLFLYLPLFMIYRKFLI